MAKSAQFRPFSFTGVAARLQLHQSGPAVEFRQDWINAIQRESVARLGLRFQSQAVRRCA